MDKFEYELKIEQIEKLINREDYSTAKKIADSMEWKKEKDPKLLAHVAELYAQAGDIDKALKLYNLAYKASSRGLLVLERMTELAIIYGQLDLAEELCEEYRSAGAYEPDYNMFKYQIAEGRGEDYVKRIPYLEKYCESELDEEAMYQLAWLYDRAGMDDKCVKMCDFIIDYFCFGESVDHAIALKLNHEELTEYQESRVTNAEGYRKDYEEYLKAQEESEKREKREKQHEEQIREDALMEQQENDLGRQVSEIVDENERKKKEVNLDALVAEEEAMAMISFPTAESTVPEEAEEEKAETEPEAVEEAEPETETEEPEPETEVTEEEEPAEEMTAEDDVAVVEDVSEEDVSEEDASGEIEEPAEYDETETADGEEEESVEESEEEQFENEFEEQLAERLKEEFSEEFKKESEEPAEEPSEQSAESVEEPDEEAGAEADDLSVERTIAKATEEFLKKAVYGKVDEAEPKKVVKEEKQELPDEETQEMTEEEAQGVADEDIQELTDEDTQEIADEPTKEEVKEKRAVRKVIPQPQMDVGKPRRGLKRTSDSSALDLMVPEGSFCVSCTDIEMGVKYAVELVRLVPADERCEHVARVSASRVNKGKFSSIEQQLDRDILLITNASKLTNTALDNLYAWMKKSMDNKAIFVDDAGGLEDIGKRRPKLMNRFSDTYVYEKKDANEWLELVDSYVDENNCVLADDAYQLFEDYLQDKEEKGDVVLGITLKDAVQDALYMASRISVRNAISSIADTKYDDEGLLILRDRHFL